MKLLDRLTTSHSLLDKRRNKTNNGFYSHYMNKSSTWCVLTKEKRKRNTVRRLETIVGNGSKPGQIHKTPAVKTGDDP